MDGAVSSITSDFDFYNHYIVHNYPAWVSGLSIHIDSVSSRMAEQTAEGLAWTPSPFYVFVFLWPIWLLGSEAIFFVLGVSLGLVSIGLFAKILVRLSAEKSIAAPFMAILIVASPLNFNFIVDSVGVSSMSAAAACIMAGFVVKQRWLRATFFLMSSLIRANFIIAFVCLIPVLILLRPRGWKGLLLDLQPALVGWILSYHFYYSTYPGGGLNYLFWTYFQGLDYAQSFSLSFLKSELGLETERQLFSAKLRIIDLIRLARLPEAWSFLVSSVALKTSVTLGFTHEKLFQSSHEIFNAKTWRVLYCVFASLPGAYSSALLAFVASIPPRERVMYGWSVLYILANSMLIGDPRYLMGVFLILLLAVARLFDLIFSPKLKS